MTLIGISATSDFAGNFTQKKTMAFKQHGGRFSNKIVQTDPIYRKKQKDKPIIDRLRVGLHSEKLQPLA